MSKHIPTRQLVARSSVLCGWRLNRFERWAEITGAQQAAEASGRWTWHPESACGCSVTIVSLTPWQCRLQWSWCQGHGEAVTHGVPRVGGY